MIFAKTAKIHAKTQINPKFQEKQITIGNFKSKLQNTNPNDYYQLEFGI